MEHMILPRIQELDLQPFVVCCAVLGIEPRACILGKHYTTSLGQSTLKKLEP